MEKIIVSDLLLMHHVKTAVFKLNKLKKSELINMCVLILNDNSKREFWNVIIDRFINEIKEETK